MIVTFLGTAIFFELEETVGLGVIVLVGVGEAEIKAGLEGVGDAVTWVEGNGVGGSDIGDGDGDATAGKEGIEAGEGIVLGDTFGVGVGEGVGNLLGDAVGVATGNGMPNAAE